MTNQEERMKRVKDIEVCIPGKRNKIFRTQFVAQMSLDYGISMRVINDYINTFILARKVVCEGDYIWRVKK